MEALGAPGVCGRKLGLGVISGPSEQVLPMSDVGPASPVFLPTATFPMGQLPAPAACQALCSRWGPRNKRETAAVQWKEKREALTAPQERAPESRAH